MHTMRMMSSNIVVSLVELNYKRTLHSHLNSSLREKDDVLNFDCALLHTTSEMRECRQMIRFPLPRTLTKKTTLYIDLLYIYIYLGEVIYNITTRPAAAASPIYIYMRFYIYYLVASYFFL